MASDLEKDTEAYLARIRRTIAESSRLVEQAQLRIAETDRMLESQGLTREQVMGFRFSEEQRELVNRELARRGMEPVDWDFGGQDTGGGDPQPQTFKPSELQPSDPQASSLRPSSAPDAELAERQRKFGMMMKPFQI